MAKINFTRIFETSKALATKSGQELQDFISYTAEAFSQVIAALRNSLTIEDNFKSLVTTVGAFHNTPQIVNTSGKIARHVIVTRVFDFGHPLTGFTWQFNNDGLLQIKAQFDGSPTTSINLTLVILF